MREPRHPFLRHGPGAVHPGAQRADAAAAQPVELGQDRVVELRAAAVPGLERELLHHVVDQRLPGRQAHRHGHARADEQHRPSVPDRPREIVEVALHGRPLNTVGPIPFPVGNRRPPAHIVPLVGVRHST
jgi:hypothetical protein